METRELHVINKKGKKKKKKKKERYTKEMDSQMMKTPLLMLIAVFCLFSEALQKRSQERKL